MNQAHYEDVKEAVLAHIQNLFQEMEENIAVSHQEKYALLEDAFENASDVNELRVAFEQWYVDHADDIGLGASAEELWAKALGGDSCYNKYEEDENSDIEGDANDYEEEKNTGYVDFKNSDEY